MLIREAIDSYDREPSTHVVAYLDILGMESKMKLDSEYQNTSLNKLYNLYRSIIDLADEINGIKNYASIKFRVFSDNIIIAKELFGDREAQRRDVKNLMSCVSNFMCSAAGDAVGWLIRGGITIGDFYINDTIVWGSALLRAYELESSVAEYPRVAIDPTVLSLLDGHEETLGFILKDFDGLNFLNYMHIWHFSGEFVQNGFEIIKNEACRPDGSYPDRVYKKLFWHMEYINQQLDFKNETSDKQYRLSLD